MGRPAKGRLAAPVSCHRRLAAELRRRYGRVPVLHGGAHHRDAPHTRGDREYVSPLRSNGKPLPQGADGFYIRQGQLPERDRLEALNGAQRQ